MPRHQSRKKCPLWVGNCRSSWWPDVHLGEPVTRGPIALPDTTEAGRLAANSGDSHPKTTRGDLRNSILEEYFLDSIPDPALHFPTHPHPAPHDPTHPNPPHRGLLQPHRLLPGADVSRLLRRQSGLRPHGRHPDRQRLRRPSPDRPPPHRPGHRPRFRRARLPQPLDGRNSSHLSRPAPAQQRRQPQPRRRTLPPCPPRHPSPHPPHRRPGNRPRRGSSPPRRPRPNRTTTRSGDRPRQPEPSAHPRRRPARLLPNPAPHPPPNPKPPPNGTKPGPPA